MNLGALLFLVLSCQVFAAPLYVLTGDELERDYLKHNRKLESHFKTLRRLIQKNAPKLLSKLSPEPPSPLVVGYQLLPKLKEEEDPREENAPNYTTTIYSWAKTRELLRSQSEALDTQVKALRTLKNLNYENLIENYRALDENQQIIGSHIQYNRMWQDQITHHKKKYLGNNELFEQLNAGKEDHSAVVKKLLDKLMAVPHKGVTLKSQGKKKVIQVAMVTDIEDSKFLKTFEDVVEKFWRVQEADVEYGVDLKIRVLIPKNLYLPDPPPKKGEQIDIVKHVERFPRGEIVLTTGTGTTYFSTASEPFVAIGVSEISKRVLAHEFGHVLSLDDAYFRAFKVDGKRGYEIFEVVPDYSDIMAAPAYGSVKRHHFELVVEALQKRN